MVGRRSQFALVSGTVAVGFEPFDDVGIEAHRNGLLRWSIELVHFGSAPIDNRRSVREITPSINSDSTSGIDRSFVSTERCGAASEQDR